VFTRDYEWLVELAAKGLSERDNHPMTKSVTTPEEFYEVMARTALEAVGLPALLDRVARAERKLRITEEALTQAVNEWADVKTENARLRRRPKNRSEPGSSGSATLPGGQ